MAKENKITTIAYIDSEITKFKKSQDIPAAFVRKKVAELEQLKREIVTELTSCVYRSKNVVLNEEELAEGTRQGVRAMILMTIAGNIPMVSPDTGAVFVINEQNKNRGKLVMEFDSVISGKKQQNIIKNQMIESSILSNNPVLSEIGRTIEVDEDDDFMAVMDKFSYRLTKACDTDPQYVLKVVEHVRRCEQIIKSSPALSGPIQSQVVKEELKKLESFLGTLVPRRLKRK